MLPNISASYQEEESFIGRFFLILVSLEFLHEIGLWNVGWFADFRRSTNASQNQPFYGANHLFQNSLKGLNMLLSIAKWAYKNI